MKRKYCCRIGSICLKSSSTCTPWIKNLRKYFDCVSAEFQNLIRLHASSPVFPKFSFPVKAIFYYSYMFSFLTGFHHSFTLSKTKCKSFRISPAVWISMNRFYLKGIFRIRQVGQNSFFFF